MATRRNSLDQPSATKAPRVLAAVGSTATTTLSQNIITARAKPKRTGLGNK